MRDALRRFVKRWSTGETIAVLAITRDESCRRSFEDFAARGDWELAIAGSFESAIESLKKNRTAVILCDRDLPGLDWHDALRKLSAATRACAILLVSPVNDEYLWEEVIRQGGFDVLVKPLQQEKAVRAVNLAWSYAKERARG